MATLMTRHLANVLHCGFEPQPTWSADKFLNNIPTPVSKKETSMERFMDVCVTTWQIPQLQAIWYLNTGLKLTSSFPITILSKPGRDHPYSD